MDGVNIDLMDGNYVISTSDAMVTNDTDVGGYDIMPLASNGNVNMCECKNSSTTTYDLKIKETVYTYNGGSIVTSESEGKGSLDNSAWSVTGTGASTSGPTLTFDKNPNGSTRTATQTAKLTYKGQEKSSSLTFEQEKRKVDHFTHDAAVWTPTNISTPTYTQTGNSFTFYYTVEYQWQQHHTAIDTCGDGWTGCNSNGVYSATCEGARVTLNPCSNYDCSGDGYDSYTYTTPKIGSLSQKSVTVSASQSNCSSLSVNGSNFSHYYEACYTSTGTSADYTPGITSGFYYDWYRTSGPGFTNIDTPHAYNPWIWPTSENEGSSTRCDTWRCYVYLSQDCYNSGVLYDWYEYDVYQYGGCTTCTSQNDGTCLAPVGGYTDIPASGGSINVPHEIYCDGFIMKDGNITYSLSCSWLSAYWNGSGQISAGKNDTGSDRSCSVSWTAYDNCGDYVDSGSFTVTQNGQSTTEPEPEPDPCRDGGPTFTFENGCGSPIYGANYTSEGEPGDYCGRVLPSGYYYDWSRTSGGEGWCKIENSSIHNPYIFPYEENKTGVPRSCTWTCYVFLTEQCYRDNIVYDKGTFTITQLGSDNDCGGCSVVWPNVSELRWPCGNTDKYSYPMPITCGEIELITPTVGSWLNKIRYSDGVLEIDTPRGLAAYTTESKSTLTIKFKHDGCEKTKDITLVIEPQNVC